MEDNRSSPRTRPNSKLTVQSMLNSEQVADLHLPRQEIRPHLANAGHPFAYYQHQGLQEPQYYVAQRPALLRPSPAAQFPPRSVESLGYPQPASIYASNSHAYTTRPQVRVSSQLPLRQPAGVYPPYAIDNSAYPSFPPGHVAQNLYVERDRAFLHHPMRERVHEPYTPRISKLQDPEASKLSTIRSRRSRHSDEALSPLSLPHGQTTSHHPGVEYPRAAYISSEIQYPPHELADMGPSLASHVLPFNIRPWLTESGSSRQVSSSSSSIVDHLWQVPYASSNSSNGRFSRKTGRDCFKLAGYKFDYDNSAKSYDVFWDHELGIVRMASFLKPLQQQKTLPNDIIEKSNLQDVAWNITGGRYEIQGYWIPYEAARAIAKNWCYDFRYALVPLFGPDFPQQCEVKGGTNYQRKDIDKQDAEAYKQSYLGRLIEEQARKVARGHRASASASSRIAGEEHARDPAPDLTPQRRTKKSANAKSKSRRQRSSSITRSQERSASVSLYSDAEASPSPPPPSAKKRKITKSKAHRSGKREDPKPHSRDASSIRPTAYHHRPGGFTAVNHSNVEPALQGTRRDHPLIPQLGYDFHVYEAPVGYSAPSVTFQSSYNRSRGHPHAVHPSQVTSSRNREMQNVQVTMNKEDRNDSQSLDDADLDCALTLANMRYMGQFYDPARARWRVGPSN